MRIAMVTDGAATGRDTDDLVTALDSLGHDVVVHQASHGRRRGEHSVAAFTRQWSVDPPAVVHNRSRIAGVATAQAARTATIPVVHSVCMTDGAPAGTVERDIALRADRVIVSCGAEQAELMAGGVPRDTISVVPYGVDVAHFTPEGERQSTVRQYRVVAVGDLTAGAGFATAVAALAGLPDTELVIAGGPPHGSHAKELRDYARKLGVSHRLRIPGPATRATLPALLRSADVVLCTPWRPQFGITALEAAACGVPVVANNTGGLTDIVIDRVTGLLVSPRRPRDLAAAAWKLLSQQVLRGQMGAAARDRACGRYSWHQIAVDTLEAYRRAGADHNTRSTVHQPM
jgi:glycosyltransferase involved in cell wall biosynthesis